MNSLNDITFKDYLTSQGIQGHFFHVEANKIYLIFEKLLSDKFDHKNMQHMTAMWYMRPCQSVVNNLTLVCSNALKMRLDKDYHALIDPKEELNFLGKAGNHDVFLQGYCGAPRVAVLNELNILRSAWQHYQTQPFSDFGVELVEGIPKIKGETKYFSLDVEGKIQLRLSRLQRSNEGRVNKPANLEGDLWYVRSSSMQGQVTAQRWKSNICVRFSYEAMVWLANKDASLSYENNGKIETLPFSLQCYIGADRDLVVKEYEDLVRQLETKAFGF